MHRARAAFAGCAIALLAGRARASEPERVHFSYDAGGAGCPSEDQFLVSVARDGGMLDRAGQRAAVRSFAVILETGAPAVGTLRVRSRDGSEATRRIQGERCEDVARSLAVLVALSLEPTPTPPPPLPLPSARVDARGPGDRRDDATAPPIERWRVGLSAEGTLATGAAPGPLVGIALYGEVAHDAPGPFAPSIRLGFETTANDSASLTGLSPSGNPTVTFARQVGRADVCPLRFTARQLWATDALSADVCARFDAGVLAVSATGASEPTNAHYAWVASGALLRLRWVASWVFVEIEGGAVVPLVRERFHFDPSVQVFEVPWVAGAGGIGMGGYFL